MCGCPRHDGSPGRCTCSCGEHGHYRLQQARAEANEEHASLRALADEAGTTKAHAKRLLASLGHHMGRKTRRVRLLPIERDAVVMTLRRQADEKYQRSLT